MNYKRHGRETLIPVNVLGSGVMALQDLTEVLLRPGRLTLPGLVLAGVLAGVGLTLLVAAWAVEAGFGLARLAWDALQRLCY